jgi:HSP20 family protein
MSRLMTDFAPLMRLQDQMNRLFEGVFEDMPALRGYGATYPGVNLWEDGDNCYVEAELPGLSMDDIQVFVTGNELTISGERKMNEPQNASYHRRERATGQFSRMITLPWEIDQDKVEAKLHDGVLTIKLAKAESAKAKKVKILSA